MVQQAPSDPHTSLTGMPSQKKLVPRLHPPEADELVGALDMLGLHVLSGGIKPRRVIPPAELVAGLAMQSDARVRLALVGLLLYRPDFALAVPLATSSLCTMPACRGADLLTLKLYYTAAMLLQKKYDAQLTQLLGEHEQLPDLFSEELAVSATGSVDTRLKERPQGSTLRQRAAQSTCPQGDGSQSQRGSIGLARIIMAQNA